MNLPSTITAKTAAIVSGGATLVVVATVAWFIHDWDVSRLKLAHNSAMTEQKTALVAACNQSMQTTKEVADALQKNLTGLSADVARYKRLLGAARAARCVPVANASGTDDGGSGQGQSAGSHGILGDALLDFAGEAEQYRLQLISCQEFVGQERAGR